MSSTFQDLVEERTALQEDALPRLRDLCRDRGVRLQVVDLRWGVSEGVALDQRTMEVCLQEIERCQQASPWLNFVVLLGDRYGWRPLPAILPATGAAQPRRAIAADEERRFARWYRLDENADPPAYRLLPRTRGDGPRAEATWATDEPLLRAALEQAAGDLPAEVRRDLLGSATEREIARGVFAALPESTVHCYVREGGDPGPGAVDRGFVDGEGGVPDPVAARALADLKARLGRAPHVRLRTARTTWQDGRPAGSPRPWLGALVYADLAEVIERRVALEAGRDPVIREAEQHRAAADERRRDFTGRADELRDVVRSVLAGGGRPAVVTGPSGSGKSALLAEAAARVAGPEEEGPLVVLRLIGATSGSTDERGLVAGLCREIDVRHRQPVSELPDDLQGLAAALLQRLRAAEGRRLVLVIDALDQLRGQARPLGWLPAVLPPHVGVLLSTTSEQWLAEQRRRFGAVSHLALEPMRPQVAEELLEHWLSRARRRLTAAQAEVVLGAFRPTGLPLHLRLSFEQARRWASYEPAPGSLPADPVALVRERLDVLGAEHGATLVAHATEYLSAAREGLAEDEVIDVLSADTAVRDEQRALSPHSPATEALPPVVWYRLAGDLRPYLADRDALGGPVLGFYHRLVAEAAAQEDEHRRRQRHEALAAYFGRNRAGGFDPTDPRPLVELPFQLAGAGRLDDLVHVVTDVRFLEARIRAGEVPDPGAADRRNPGVADLLSDLSLAAQALAATSQTEPDDRARTVRALWSALRTEAHHLSRRPELLRQQLVNRLQVSAPHLADEFVGAPPPATPTWLRRLSAPGTSAALTRTLGGHDRLGGCALSDDGRVLVGGGRDRHLTVWDRPSGIVLAELVGHDTAVLTFVLTPDGNRVISAGADDTLRTWDAMSGTALSMRPIETGETTACALSGDGTLVLTGHRSGQLCTWPVDGEGSGRVLPGAGTPVRTCAVSRDGALGVAGRADGAVDLVRLDTGVRTSVASPHDGPVRACLLTDDARLVVTAGEDGYVRWHDAAGTLQAEHRDDPGGVFALAASPRWDVVASGGFDGALRIRDTGNGRLRAEPAPDELSSINACAVGDRLAVAVHVEGVLSVWDVATGRRLAVLRGHAGDTTACLLEPEGRGAVTAGVDGAVRLWDLDVLDEPAYDGHRSLVTDSAFSPDGAWAVTTSTDGTARVWLPEGRMLRTLDDHFLPVEGCAIAPRGEYFATTGADAAVHLYADRGAQHVGSIDVGGSGTGCVFGSDGSWLAVATDDGAVHVRSIPDLEERTVLTGHTGVVTGLVPLADPHRLVTAGRDGSLRSWDVDTGRCQQVLAEGLAAVDDCAWSREGTAVTTGADGGVRVWDLAGGALRRHLAADRRWLRCAVSADGQRVGATGVDGEVRLWSGEDLGDGRPVAHHDGPVRACALSADGRLLLTGGDDDVLRLVDLDRGSELAVLPLDGRPVAVALHPREPLLLCGDDGGAVTLARLDRFGPAGPTGEERRAPEGLPR
ncbi:AAA family ATPase [Geodermatophilus sp. URMC 62]|uniref:AAA family ATPase n=1 Tax=Geodermatophilus sp. URMC 62 TaxID=3423414 RepID=UPI00406CB43E